MKTFLNVCTLALALISFSSCEKVIEVDLNSKDPQVVIEGMITDDTLQPVRVKITKSLNFSENNNFPAVSGAVVTLRDDLGNTATLLETDPGVYTDSAFHGQSGRTYSLTVVAEGKTYTSSCTMPQRVSLDSLIIGEVGFGPGPTSGKSAIPKFTDPNGRGNYYRFILYENSIPSSEILLYDDQIIDGAENNQSLFSQQVEINTGDTIRVEMQCISKEVHFFFYSLNQNGNGPDASASPANPKSNIEGATLGYFSAHTSQTRVAIVQ